MSVQSQVTTSGLHATAKQAVSINDLMMMQHMLAKHTPYGSLHLCRQSEDMREVKHR